VKSAIDAYDNYEGYIPWLQPLHYLWRKSLAKATLVTAAGPSLIQEFQKSRGARPAVTVPMAVDPSGFVPLDRRTCREGLGLPLDKKLIGYCGGISSSRGIETLFDAYVELVKQRPEVELILSGRKDKNLKLPSDAHWLGYLPDEAVPRLLNSLDVLVVSNRPSKFGRFSHPVKLYEAMACNIPVVASATPSTRWILRDHPELLVEPGSPSELRETIERVLTKGRIDYGHQADWDTSCEIFEQALEKYR
jgi:glycosyltransferase involved in cell wall biosynthesis